MADPLAPSPRSSPQYMTPRRSPVMNPGNGTDASPTLYFTRRSSTTRDTAGVMSRPLKMRGVVRKEGSRQGLAGAGYHGAPETNIPSSFHPPLAVKARRNFTEPVDSTLRKC